LNPYPGFYAIPGSMWPGAIWPGNTGQVIPAETVFTFGLPYLQWAAGSPDLRWAAGEPCFRWAAGSPSLS
jgi:hypothetical protein